jgi:hypothetical protein
MISHQKEGIYIRYNKQGAKTSTNNRLLQGNALNRRYKKSLIIMLFLYTLTGITSVPCVRAQGAGVIVASGDLEGYPQYLRGMIDIFQLNDTDPEADHYRIYIQVHSNSDPLWRIFEGFSFNIKCNPGGMIRRWDAQLFTLKMANCNFLRWTIERTEGELTNEFRLIALGYQTTWCDIVVELKVPNDAGLDISVTVTIQWPKPDKETPTTYESGIWSEQIADLSPG